MRRSKPRQHKRKLKSGRVVVVNKGVKAKSKKRIHPEQRVKMISEGERDYIIDTYGQEPEDLPYYEVDDAINERRELKSKKIRSKSVNQGLYIDKKKKVPSVGTDSYEDFLWDNGFKTNPSFMYSDPKDFEAAEKFASKRREAAKKVYDLDDR